MCSCIPFLVTVTRYLAAQLRRGKCDLGSVSGVSSWQGWRAEQSSTLHGGQEAEEGRLQCSELPPSSHFISWGPQNMMVPSTFRVHFLPQLILSGNAFTDPPTSAPQRMTDPVKLTTKTKYLNSALGVFLIWSINKIFAFF